MGKTIRKMLVGDSWRIGEHESWFSQLASEGLHLKKVGWLFASFTKGEAKETRYRIDTSLNKQISTADKELYRESGWEHVSTFGWFNVFSSPAELDAAELHTDPVEQSYTLVELDKKVRMNTVLGIILSIIGIGIQWWLRPLSTLSFVRGEGLAEVGMAFIYLLMAYTLLRASISIRNLRKILATGSPINHQAPWKKHRRMTLALHGSIITLATIFAVLPWGQLALNREYTLPRESGELPLVRLADIENNAKLVREEFRVAGDVDIMNRYQSGWSLFAPLQYESRETGIVPGQLWQEDGMPYSPSLHTQVYKLNFPSMKDNLLADLTREYALHIYEGDLTEVESNVFDTLIIHQGDLFREVFAAKGRGVIYVSYVGKADTGTILKLVEEKIALIEE